MATTLEDTSPAIECHYDVLGLALDTDADSIKKAHRLLARKHHPDKGGDQDVFKRIQEAYECLSDPASRQWYDEHRSAILQGWSSHNREGDSSLIFDVTPFLSPTCFDGFDDTTSDGFYGVYQHVFRAVAQEEAAASSDSHLPHEFGQSGTEWSKVSEFYQAWASFASQLSFAWADLYDPLSEPNRRIRRAMEDANKKARKTARKDRNSQIQVLVAFVKKRDPRVAEHADNIRKEKQQNELEQKRKQKQKKEKRVAAAQQWRKEAAEEIERMEEEDRLAGRIRLADLEDDDYDYSFGKKGKKNKKKGVRRDDDEEEEKENENLQDNPDGSAPTQDHELNSGEVATAKADDAFGHSVDSEDESSEEDETPDVWRCECCRKEFKSSGQMDNHMRSKKHKEAFKKFQDRIKQ